MLKQYRTRRVLSSLCVIAVGGLVCFSRLMQSGQPALGKSPIKPVGTLQAAAAAAPHSAQSEAQGSPEWQEEAFKRILDAEYAIQDAEQGFHASNRQHNLSVAFDGEGVVLTSRRGVASELRLGVASVGRAGQTAQVPPGEAALAACRQDGAKDIDGTCLRVLDVARGNVTERWDNRPDGIEHTVVVHEAPDGEGELEVTVRLEGVRAKVSRDGQGATLEGAALGGLRYDHLLVTDASGEQLEAWMEERGEALALVVNDEYAEYPVTIDPLLTTHAWQIFGDIGLARLGWSVASAGDVNGDGIGDIVIGAPRYARDFNAVTSGLVLVYLGDKNGGFDLKPYSREQRGEGFGASVAGVGDVNNDGFGDVLVGALGEAVLYYGGATKWKGSVSIPAPTSTPESDFGKTVAAAGDFNGDTLGDFIVVGWRYDSTGARARVHLYLGSATGPREAVGSPLQGSLEARSDYPKPVAGLGDVDRDGYADFAFGAPHEASGSLAQAGAVYLYRGNSQGTLGSAWAIRRGTKANASFGYAVSGGDINGDSFADLIVNARSYAPSNGQYSRLYVYNGAASLPAQASSFIDGNFEYVVGAGDVNGDGFGDVLSSSPRLYLGSSAGLGSEAVWQGGRGAERGALAAAGDLNGDGFADVIIGGYTQPNPLIYPSLGFEGSATVYAGSPSGVLAGGPSWLEQDQPGAGLGASVAGAGDVNGDGFGDVIVGAPSYDDGSVADVGCAFVFMGPTTVRSSATKLCVPGAPTGSSVGGSVAGAGDVNGDGYADVIVGAPEGGTGQGTGKAYLFLGSASGVVTTPAWSQAGRGLVGGQFGYSVGGAGDVNGDGYADVVVGSPYDSSVSVYLGSNGGLGPNAQPTLTPPASIPRGNFGISVAGAGDVNGDGYSDVIVGAYTCAKPTQGEGCAYVYKGSSAGLSTLPLWIGEGNQGAAYFGNAVASAGDVNGDGYGDVIVGAYGHSAGQDAEGRAYVYLGSATGPGLAPAWKMESNLAWGLFGWAVSSAGDVNGDGFADVLVGSEYHENSRGYLGRAHLYMGSPTGLGATAAWVAKGTQPSGVLGRSVASAGDVNGDGLGDAIVGSSGHSTDQTSEGGALLYMGNNGDASSFNFMPRARACRAGTACAGDQSVIAPGGLAIGQAFDVVCTFNFGSTLGKLQVEVLPPTRAFAGMPGYTGGELVVEAPEWTSSGRPQQSVTISNLTPGVAYHWRARFLFQSPVNGRTASRWVYGGASGDPHGVHVRAAP